MPIPVGKFYPDSPSALGLLAQGSGFLISAATGSECVLNCFDSARRPRMARWVHFLTMQA